MSGRVMETLWQFTDQVEVYSCDQAFPSLSDRPRTLAPLAVEIRRLAKNWSGRPVSIGIGPTKTWPNAPTRSPRTTTGSAISLIPPTAIASWHGYWSPISGASATSTASYCRPIRSRTPPNSPALTTSGPGAALHHALGRTTSRAMSPYRQRPTPSAHRRHCG